MGPVILQCVAASNTFSVMHRVGLDQLKDGKPVRAILASLVLVFCALFVGSKDYDTMATLVTMFFLQARVQAPTATHIQTPTATHIQTMLLQAYASVHGSCLLMELISLPNWRPAR